MKVCAALAVGVVVTSCAITGCKKSDNGQATTRTSASGDRDRAAGAPGAGALSYDIAPDDPRAAVVAKLSQLYEGAPVSGFITDAERLARARAWVNEHRADADDRMREVEAQYLAVMLEFLDGDAEMSLGQLMHLSSLQMLDLWALDADRDGELSDEELAAGNFMSRMDPTTHPLLAERYDTDGDGIVSEQEQAAAQQAMMETSQNLMAGIGDEIMARLADADGDGVVSPEERTAALDATEQPEWFMQAADTDGDGVLTEDEQAAFIEMQGEGGVESLEQLAQMMYVQDFMQRLELIPNQQATVQAAMTESMPQPVDPMQFDLDGDGQVNPGTDEMELYTEANQAYMEQVQEWSTDWQSRWQRMRFDATEPIIDTNGDGIATDAEWAASYPRLEGERDARLFTWMYDADQSGSVGPGEADAFIRWAQAGHPRADLNFDGAVSREDIMLFTDLFVAQSE